MIRIDNFINGEIVPPIKNQYLDNIQPATGEVYGLIPDSDEEDVIKAVEVAKNAFSSWSNLNPKKRYQILSHIAELIRLKQDELALAESMDNGKPVHLAAAMDIPRAADNFEFFANAIQHITQESYATSSSIHSFTLRKPLGVVACISPWNLPLYLFTWKIAPALATGNCVVAKPSEVTPYTSFLLAQICKEAGLPAGVLNIIHGTGLKVGVPLVEHKDIKAVSFTGGTNTGMDILNRASKSFKKTSLELGGKNSVIIFEDCDFDQMMDSVVKSSFTNQGQICLCTSKILIQDALYERFKEEFVARVQKLKVGDPKDPNTHQGAIVSKAHLQKINTAVANAVNEGGKILTGGEILNLSADGLGGYFFPPTILEGLGISAKINQEEVFGPVVTLQKFGTSEEALNIANDTRYGLANVVWSSNTNTIHQMTEQLESGIIWVNCWLVRDLRTPFGGVKESGMGREGGWFAMNFFTEPRSITQTFK